MIKHRGEHRFTMLTPALHYRHHAASKCTFGTQNVSRDGLKLRYLDVNGQIIQGVERDVDEISRP